MNKIISSLKPAILYFPNIYNPNDVNEKRVICLKYAFDNGYLITYETDDFSNLWEIAYKPTYTAIIFPSYYAFASDPHDIGFKALFEKRGIETLSATESFDDCHDLKELYEHYKMKCFHTK
jgi:hypothetical protein